MKKAIAIIVAIAIVLGGGWFVYDKFFSKSKDKTELVLTSESVRTDIIDKYVAMIEALKQQKNATVEVNTSVKTTNAESSLPMFNAAIEEFMKIDEESAEQYTFKDGISAEDSNITLPSLIPPEVISEEGIDYTAVVSANVADSESEQTLTLTVAEETAELTSLFNNTESDEFSIASAAPKHTQFVNVDDMVSSMMNMFGGGAEEEPTTDSGEEQGPGGNPFSGGDDESPLNPENSTITIGATTIDAVTSNNQIRQLKILMPVTMHIEAKMMGLKITMEMQFTVTKQYTITYME